MKKEQIRQHIDVLLEMERLWKDSRDKEDSGDFTQRPSSMYCDKNEIVKRFTSLRMCLEEIDS